MQVHNDWLLTAQRAAIHVPTATAVIADLHLGYDAVRRATGEAVPESDVRAALTPLAVLAAQHGVRRLVVAGDLCEDARREAPLHDVLAELARLGVELAGIVPGNHDRTLGGDHLLLDGIVLGDWRIVHGDRRAVRGRQVQGHVHPCIRWEGVAAPCFLIAERRLVLPAFSGDAAGVNVLGDRAWERFRCGVIVGAQVLDFGVLLGLKSRLAASRRRAWDTRSLPTRGQKS